MLTFTRGARSHAPVLGGFSPRASPLSALLAWVFGEQEPLGQAGRMGYFCGGTCRKAESLQLSCPRPRLEPKQHEVTAEAVQLLGTAATLQEFGADPGLPGVSELKYHPLGWVLRARSRVLSSAAFACVFCLLLQ